MLTKEEMPACPVATTVQMSGSKCVSQKVLTDSLRSMEEDGIITRTVYPEVPPRVEYALSELGESMRPIMKAMEQWGLEYKKTKPVTPE